MIKVFEDQIEYLNFLTNKNIDLLDSGTEGKCYLANDGLVYKIIYNHMFNYKLNQIITKEMCNLKHFAFPIDLFVDKNNDILGYSSEYLKDNIFDEEDYMGLFNIDLDKLKEEYIDMVKDVIFLSLNKIYMQDLQFNLLFNNKELKAIDTLGYKIKENVLKENLDLILESIISYFGFNVHIYNYFRNVKTIDEFCDVYKRVIKR